MVVIWTSQLFLTDNHSRPTIGVKSATGKCMYSIGSSWWHLRLNSFSSPSAMLFLWPPCCCFFLNNPFKEPKLFVLLAVSNCNHASAEQICWVRLCCLYMVAPCCAFSNRTGEGGHTFNSCGSLSWIAWVPCETFFGSRTRRPNCTSVTAELQLGTLSNGRPGFVYFLFLAYPLSVSENWLQVMVHELAYYLQARK